MAAHETLAGKSGNRLNLAGSLEAHQGITPTHPDATDESSHLTWELLFQRLSGEL